MHIISHKKIRQFSLIHPQSENPLENWYRIVKHEEFKTFADVRRLFPSADQVGNFTIFNIGGNKFRLICFIRYETRKIYIRYILTHPEYDTGRWRTDQWFKTT